MTDRFRRWGRRLLWAFPIALAVYVAVSIADYAWFTSHVPVRFRDANWEGHWKTHRYGGLSGRLLVRLPDPLPADVDFKVEALVYYPVYSVWRTGQFVRMDFTGHFRPDSSDAGGQTTNDLPAGGGMLKFKGSMGSQIVEYAALLDDSRTDIVGGYTSRNPDDIGHFGLSRY